MVDYQRIINWANQVLGEVQDYPTALLENHEAELVSPVFIVGVPRSGTTLAHQLLVRRLDIGYIDNIIARFWRRPSVGIALSGKIVPAEDRGAISLRSDFGRSRESAGPHEFGYFWNYWCKFTEDKPHHVSKKDRQKLDSNGLRHAILEILYLFQRPVVFKNLTCGFQADLLAQLFPECTFIYIERNPLHIGRSILHSRLKMYGNYTAWLSLKPSTWPFTDLNSNPAASVAKQIADCRNEVLQKITPLNHKIMQYEDDVCKAPENFIHSVNDAIGYNGLKAALRGELLSPLQPRIPEPLPDKLETDLHRELKRQGLT